MPEFEFETEMVVLVKVEAATREEALTRLDQTLLDADVTLKPRRGGNWTIAGKGCFSGNPEWEIPAIEPDAA